MGRNREEQGGEKMGKKNCVEKQRSMGRENGKEKRDWEKIILWRRRQGMMRDGDVTKRTKRNMG